MRQRGHSLATELLYAGMVSATRHVATALGVATGDLVVRITRRRFVDGEPIALQTSYLRPEMAALMDDPGVASGSLYEAMERCFGRRPTEGREEYTAVVVAGDDANLLGLPNGSACLAVRRFARSRDGYLVEYAESLLRGDRYTLYVDLGNTAGEARQAKVSGDSSKGLRR
ncbi:GntR family transcriptional regulator [Carboxydichorda subterranea]|uniref:GntR family transcriptional regulator n=1 Tax=Carboxydichorda subterranea TaxID=3109565 RepID=UPI003857C14C